MSLLTLRIAHLFIFLCRGRQQNVRGNFAELFEGFEIVNDFLGKGKSGSGRLSDSSRLSSLSQKVNLQNVSARILFLVLRRVFIRAGARETVI